MNDSILLAREHDRGAVRRALAAGELERLRRGAYRTPRPTSRVRGEDERRRALDRVQAVHRQLRAEHVFSHATAALLWGAPLWTVPTVTHVRTTSRPSSRAAADILRHVGLPEVSLELDGVPVTDLERTVVDCAITMHPLHGLVIADWALAHGLDLPLARRLLAACRRRNGTARARFVLDHADRHAEPPWETWLRYMALRSGLPRPRTQFPVATREGQFFVDLAWPEHHVLAEFDGKVKYADGAFGPSYDADDARFDEKVREDAITENLGVRPLRFVAKHAARPDLVTARLLAAFPEDVRRRARINPLLPLP